MSDQPVAGTTTPVQPVYESTEDVTPDALAKRIRADDWSGSVLVAFTPQECLVRSVPPDVDLESAYQVTVHHPERELRWTRTDDASGRLVVVEEGPAESRDGDDAGGWLDPVERREFLWGTVRSVTDGTIELAEGRIGTIRIPALDLDVSDGQALVAVIRSYRRSDRYGNVRVHDERVVGFRPSGPNAEDVGDEEAGDG